MGDGLAHQFGVIEDEESREIRVDANGNGDFRDETPMGDINERVDVRRLTLAHPATRELGFVVARAAGRRARCMSTRPPAAIRR